jgi:hypothetical protein
MAFRASDSVALGIEATNGLRLPLRRRLHIALIIFQVVCCPNGLLKRNAIELPIPFLDCCDESNKI